MATSTPILPSSLAPRVMPKQRHEAPKRHPHDDNRRWRLAGPKTLLTNVCEMIITPREPVMLPAQTVAACRAQITNIANQDTRALLRLIVSYAEWWHRDPDTWTVLGEYLHGLDRPVAIWSAAANTGHEPYSAAIACHRAAVADFSIEASDINSEFINVARQGRYPTTEVRRFVPDWQAFFDYDGDSCQVREQISERMTFNVADIGRITPPQCDVAIVADVWKVPGLTDEQQQHLLHQLDAQLADDGLLMLGPYDLIEWDGLNLQALEQGRQRGAEFYSPPPLLLEHFEPLQPNGPAFQLIWRKRRPHTTPEARPGGTPLAYQNAVEALWTATSVRMNADFQAAVARSVAPCSALIRRLEACDGCDAETVCDVR